MSGGDKNHQDAPETRSRREMIWEYGLIVAGLAVIVTFGTHSLSRTMKDSVQRSTVDMTTTSSIGVKKAPGS